MSQDLQRVFVASGEIHAGQVRAFLEAAGIATAVRAESLRQTHGLTVDGLGAVEILVAGKDLAQARSLLSAAEDGRFRLGDDTDISDAQASASMPGGSGKSARADQLQTIERLVGTYSGSGEWHDSTGKSSTYDIRQTNRLTDEGFEIAFTHDFADGTVVDARFQMAWVAPHIFMVSSSGAPIGHGYVFGGHCHYHLETGQAFVEASYHCGADAIEVFGSSTKNAEGRYIAWKEVLRRSAGASAKAEAPAPLA